VEGRKGEVMATTYRRICVRDYERSDSEGNRLELSRGREYLTSAENENGDVVVFTNFWVQVPVSIFAGEIRFT